jgi:hypothetical protein
MSFSLGNFFCPTPSGIKEYLFDLTPAFINVFEGANTVADLEELCRGCP